MATRDSAELKLKVSFQCEKSLREKKNTLFEILNFKKKFQFLFIAK